MNLALKDTFGRVLNYVRISVTDRCNYRCRYCMPEDGIDWIPHEEIMTYENILLLVSVLKGLGVKRIRFTGGEPFVRRGFIQFLEEVIGTFPSIAVAVTTNGSFLERDAKYLAPLPLDSLNISLDTLDEEKFRQMTRTGDLNLVLRGIDSVVKLRKTPVKLNTVVMRDFNLQEVPEIISYSREKGLFLRFIEFMPLDSDVWLKKQFVPVSEILSLLPDPALWLPLLKGEESSLPETPRGPARYLVNSVTGQMIGVISAVSEHFCETCNRLRVTSTGEVRPCLFSSDGVSIIEALRRGDAKGVREGMLAAALNKPCEGATGIPAVEPLGHPKEERHMSRIGG